MAPQEKAPSLERLRTAQLCIAFQIKRRQVELEYMVKLAARQAKYERLINLSGEADLACRRMTNLCLSNDSAALTLVPECATRLDQCAAECKSLNEALLTVFARACREASSACRNLTN